MKTSNRPNVLIFVSHDTGRHISPYGIRTVHTPNAERLAAEGVVLENCFCTAPQCSPSRASIFTGRYPHNTGMLGLANPRAGWDLAADEVHAAEHFRRLGYDTVLVGIAHEAATHESRGWDTIRPERGAHAVGPVLGEWLDQRKDSRKPFYAQVGIFETHIPFTHDGAGADDSLGLTVPPYLVDSEGTRHDLRGLQGSVRRWDQAVGGIMHALDARGLAENTILVVTTDHGIAFPRAKCTLFDSGIGVLCLIRWPAGGIGGGRRFAEMISNLDLLPAPLNAAGAAVPDRIQGRSFLPLLTGGRYQPRDVIFAEQTFHEHYEPVRGLRTGRYKYFRYFDQGGTIDIPSDMRLNRMYTDNVRQLVNSPSKREMENLFDLQADPWERVNLAGSTEHEGVRAELSRMLADWMLKTDDPLLHGPVPSPWYRRCIETLGR